MLHDKTKTKIHPAIYRYHQHHLRGQPLRTRVLFYLLAIVFLIFVAVYISSGFQTVSFAGLSNVFSRVSPLVLLFYTALSFLRIFSAYIAGLALTSLVVLLVMFHERVENFLIPILDILQSVPILAFFPLLIIVFARLHLPEIAAFIILLIAAIWPVMFGALGGLHQIPQDIHEAAAMYGATGLTKFRKIIFPAILPNIITGSLVFWGEGWNIVIISEYSTYGNTSINLRGLGNLLSSSSGKDTGVFVASLVMLVITIIVLNRAVWHRLLSYSERFKFE